ncbi:MAG TPA: MBL fold metallo-hydrolase [bacterium]|nr:MBL fold metallo-hydrolase [bacterium]
MPHKWKKSNPAFTDTLPTAGEELHVAAVDGGLCINGGQLWIDTDSPHDLAVVSHAHGDHIAPHRNAIMTPETACFFAWREFEAGPITELPYRTPLQLDNGLTVELLSAGHILGSAMVHVSDGRSSLLYTGDFKLRGALTCPPADPKHADVLVMETTFGLPNFIFPPIGEVRRQIVDFARETLEAGGTPVFLGYSLGKSQEIAAILCQAGIPVACHGAVWNMLQLYTKFGCAFPTCCRYAQGEVQNMALITMPGTESTPMVKRLKKPRVAYCSGWAVLEKNYQAMTMDALIPLSDHADFPELLELVDLVRPGLVYTIHGYTEPFAYILRQRGVDAIPLESGT